MRRLIKLGVVMAVVATVAALLVPAGSAGARPVRTAAPATSVHPMSGCQVGTWPDPYYPLTVCDSPVIAGYAPVGTICSNTEYLVKSGHPIYIDGTGHKYTDLYMTVWFWYSVKCKDVWIEAKNTKAVGRVYCNVEVGYIGGAAEDFSCPAAGHAIHTIAWDDACPTNCTMSYGSLWEHLPGYIYPSFNAEY